MRIEGTKIGSACNVVGGGLEGPRLRAHPHKGATKAHLVEEVVVNEDANAVLQAQVLALRVRVVRDESGECKGQRGTSL